MGCCAPGELCSLLRVRWGSVCSDLGCDGSPCLRGADWAAGQSASRERGPGCPHSPLGHPRSPPRQRERWLQGAGRGGGGGFLPSPPSLKQPPVVWPRLRMDTRVVSSLAVADCCNCIRSHTCRGGIPGSEVAGLKGTCIFGRFPGHNGSAHAHQRAGPPAAWEGACSGASFRSGLPLRGEGWPRGDAAGLPDLSLCRPRCHRGGRFMEAPPEFWTHGVDPRWVAPGRMTMAARSRNPVLGRLESKEE